MSLLINGSAAFDSIQTPSDRRERIIGGSGVHAAYAGSFFAPVCLVAVVGDDWPESNTRLLREKKIDTEGLEIRSGAKTLYWSGKYFENMDDRETLDIQPNVMGAEYVPIVPDDYKKIKTVFLANTSPSTHLALLRQMEAPSLVIADTMDFYINGERDALDELLTKIDGLVLNESEIRLLTGERDLLKAARKGLDLGPQFLIVKKGENGAMFLSRTALFLIPAYPSERVVDPTGAGDSFAGALAAYLSREGEINDRVMKNALLYATVTASFQVEGFSLERLREIDGDAIERRADTFRAMVNIPAGE